MSLFNKCDIYIFMYACNTHRQFCIFPFVKMFSVLQEVMSYEKLVLFSFSVCYRSVISLINIYIYT